MRTTTLSCRVVLGAWMLIAAGTAAADDSGLYAALDGGKAQVPKDASVRLGDYALTSTKVESNDYAWSLAVGYRFDATIALEAGFVDFGTARAGVADPSGLTDGRGTIDYSTKGFTLALLAHRQFGNWDPYVKLGAIRSEVSLQREATMNDLETQSSVIRHSTKALAGAGVRYAFADRWALTFAADYYVKLGVKNATGTSNVFSPRLGIAFRF